MDPRIRVPTWLCPWLESHPNWFMNLIRQQISDSHASSSPKCNSSPSQSRMTVLVSLHTTFTRTPSSCGYQKWTENMQQPQSMALQDNVYPYIVYKHTRRIGKVRVSPIESLSTVHHHEMHPRPNSQHLRLKGFLPVWKKMSTFFVGLMAFDLHIKVQYLEPFG